MNSISNNVGALGQSLQIGKSKTATLADFAQQMYGTIPSQQMFTFDTTSPSGWVTIKHKIINHTDREFPMTKDTQFVVMPNGGHTGFCGEKAGDEALEKAQEIAHRDNATVYIMKVYKVVKPRREVDVEEVG